MNYPAGYEKGFDCYMQCGSIKSNPFDRDQQTLEHNNFIIGYADAAYQRDFDPKRTVQQAIG